MEKYYVLAEDLSSQKIMSPQITNLQVAKKFMIHKSQICKLLNLPSEPKS
jgi:hypothetical protein